MSGARAACVIGWPAAHSRSPLIHNYWLKTHGIAGEYRREAVPPEQFAEFVRNLAAHGYVGANVTIPHKEAALALSQPDATARAVGAANTLWLDNGTLRSTNTDAEGFLANLDVAAPGWDRGLETALVLGAGGAARAVLYGLIGRGVTRIHLANRTPERALALARQFGDGVHPVGWDEPSGLLAGCALLVNTTSLGMAGQPPLDLNIKGLPPSAVVADLVYAPLVTPLLAAARARGLRTADGLGMLLHQAVRGFALWFGVTPEVTPELRALVEDDLARA
jgi:shikimate dehydrogenase